MVWLNDRQSSIAQWRILVDRGEIPKGITDMICSDSKCSVIYCNVIRRDDEVEQDPWYDWDEELEDGQWPEPLDIQYLPELEWITPLNTLRSIDNSSGVFD